MANKYDEAYDITVHMARAKMAMNSHKGNIEDKDVSSIISMAKRELDELEEAISSGDYLHIIEEVADVLNFSIAASYKALDNYRNRRGKQDVK